MVGSNNTKQSSKSNKTNQNNTNTTNKNINLNTLPNNRRFIFVKNEPKSLSPQPDFDTSGYDAYRQRERELNKPKQPLFDTNRKQLQSSTHSTIHQHTSYVPPQHPTPGKSISSFSTNKNQPTNIPANASTQSLHADTNLTAQDPVVQQPHLAPLPTAGLTPGQRASQTALHNIQQQISDNQHHVGALVEHFINSNNNRNRDQDSSSLEHHQRKEYNKYFSQKKVDLEMQFKVKKKLPASTDMNDGVAQVEVLE